MVLSEAEAVNAGELTAVSPQQAKERSAGVLIKPPYFKRFFKQLWTLLYHKQGTSAMLTNFCSTLCCWETALLTVHMLPAARVILRNRVSTIIRLVVAPFLFILLVFVIDRAISSGNQSIVGMMF